MLAVLVTASAAVAAAPDPGGSESARFSGPPPGKFFGFAGVRPTGQPDPATAAAQVASLGGNMTRTAMHWSGMEPRRDRYAEGVFSQYQQLYDVLRARQIKPILMIQFAPVWARDPGAPTNCGAADACHYPPAVSMLGEWREFIAYVAQRFPAAAIEVWNEPNYPNQWQSGIDPERYAQLLAEARAAAHAVNPGMMILAGGLGMEPKAGWLEGGEFLRRAYAATPSLKGNTDAINFHAYPTDDMGAGSTFAEMFASVRSARAAARDGNTPLLITEMGATTSGPQAIDEGRQAQRIMRALRRIYSMEDTLGALVYTLADRTEIAASDPERGFGVIHAQEGLLGSNVEPKEAWCALRRATGIVLLEMGCPPETEIKAAPAKIAAGDSATFAFSSPDAIAIGFECSLDGGPFQGCRTPISYRGLAPGEHRFAVRARDVLGRADRYPATGTFALDRNDRRLELAVDPARSKVSGKRGAKLRVTVVNPGAPLPTTGVEVCMRVKAKLVQAAQAPCRSVSDIAPGGSVTELFRLVPKRKARGKTVDARFEANAERTLSGKARARIKIR
jgi:hypothetical protein